MTPNCWPLLPCYPRGGKNPQPHVAMKRHRHVFARERRIHEIRALRAADWVAVADSRKRFWLEIELRSSDDTFVGCAKDSPLQIQLPPGVTTNDRIVFHACNVSKLTP